MKKILAILSFLLPLSVFAIDDFGLKAPQWKDFAPSAFVDVKEPRGFGKLNVTAKYWFDRRVSFERRKEARLVTVKNTIFMCQNVCQNVTKTRARRKNK